MFCINGKKALLCARARVYVCVCGYTVETFVPTAFYLIFLHLYVVFYKQNTNCRSKKKEYISKESLNIIMWDKMR